MSATQAALRGGNIADRGWMSEATQDQDNARWSKLMSSAQSGDEQAYRALLGELALVIKRYLLSRFGYHDQLDDCVQECLLGLHDARHTYDPRRPFKPWLFAIVRHKAVDHLRKLGPRRQVVTDPATVDRLAEIAADQGFQDECRERELALHDCLRRLSAKAKRVVRAIYHEDLSAEECAAREGGKPGAIWTMLSRVRTQLRGCIEAKLGSAS